MKHLLLIFAIIAMAMSGGRVSAVDDTWGFLYEFHFTYSKGTITVASPYKVSSGEVPQLPPGEWTIAIKDSKERLIRAYSFEPALVDDGKDLTIFLPLESRGSIAEVINPRGVAMTKIDISLSQVCNDDAVCRQDAGETQANCPTDCPGDIVSDDRLDGSATIVRQVSVSEKVGGYLMRFSAAVAGLVVLFGVVQILDNRRRT